jgi:OOP family OmpA-OmpF porin
MIGPKLAALALVSLLLFAGSPRSSAQTIGYSQALGELATTCGRDINRFCRSANLGGGQVADCLERHSSRVSSACKTTSAKVAALLQERALARASVRHVCELDRLRFCGGIQPGNAQILSCMYASRNALSPACRQALANSGYEAPSTRARLARKFT